MSFDRAFSNRRKGNDILIRRLDNPSCVEYFIRTMRKGLQEGYQEFNIKIDSRNATVFPNACVPITAIIEHYRKMGVNISLEFSNHDYLRHCHFGDPLYLSSNDISNLDTPFDKIFCYDTPAHVAAYTQKYIDSISQQLVCEKDIINSLIWCINEVMDNVLTHSKCDCGYVMAQLHTNNKHIALCISDTGIGIFNTLKNSCHRPTSSIDALSLCIQEGVGDGEGQGNGLFGLHQIIKFNEGRLRITSGPSALEFIANQENRTYTNIQHLGSEHHGVIVDFQIDLDKQVNLTSIFSSIGGFDPFDKRLDDMLQDNDSLLYDVFNHASGTATRKAGELLRNDIQNIIIRTNIPVTLDFTKVSTVSSSFIDELIAKLVLEFGFIRFNQVITIKGMNETIRHLCNRSIYMRIYEEWANRTV